jgi:hypothetical protein
MVGGTVNSRKLKGGVFKKIAAAKSAQGGGGGGNNNGFEFTVRESSVKKTFTVFIISKKSKIHVLSDGRQQDC